MIVPFWAVAISYASLITAGIVLIERAYTRGLHLGVTCPGLACKRLIKRGYDMHYMMKDIEKE